MKRCWRRPPIATASCTAAAKRQTIYCPNLKTVIPAQAGPYGTYAQRCYGSLPAKDDGTKDGGTKDGGTKDGGTKDGGTK